MYKEYKSNRGETIPKPLVWMIMTRSRGTHMVPKRRRRSQETISHIIGKRRIGSNSSLHRLVLRILCSQPPLQFADVRLQTGLLKEQQLAFFFGFLLGLRGLLVERCNAGRVTL